MFSGIIQGQATVKKITQLPSFLTLEIELPPPLTTNLLIGASVAIDGVCLTVVSIKNNLVTFDVIAETLNLTTLSKIQVNQLVNVERSLKYGDEIGGHPVSGHVHGTGQIINDEVSENNRVITIETVPEIGQYIIHKGFIAIDGISLTIVNSDQKTTFSVALIPETRKITTLGEKKTGDLVNLEIDQQTKTIVDTLKNPTLK